MFGERLREERNKLGFSQEFFGEAAGVRKLSQIKYEKGERYPDLKYLTNILDMGCDVFYIISGTRMSNTLTPSETHLLTLFNQASTPLQEAAIRILDDKL